MGGINTLGGLNTVGVDYRPEANPAAPDAANANQPQQGGDIQDDGDIIHNGEPPARPASLIRQLDTLLLNAAGKSVSASAETKGKAISETLCEKDIITVEESDKLDSLAKDAADKLKALDNFSGRELAKALMTKSGDLVWRKGFFGGMKPVTIAVKAAVEAQEALSAELAKLNDRLARSDDVDAKLQEDFTELQFQCDAMLSRINAMEREFTSRIKDILTTFQSQIALYDAIAGDGTDPDRVRDAEAAIEAEATLEKLASPTTCMSRGGQVQLRHLEVAPKDRKPATIRRNAEGGYTVSLSGVKGAECEGFLNKLKDLVANGGQHTRLSAYVKAHAHHDPASNTITINMDAAKFHEFIHALKEEDVYRLKHPTDFPTRP